MLPNLPTHRLATADEMSQAIRHILSERDEKAARSQYDVMVCVRSVAAAREAFEEVAVEGTALDYGGVVLAALDVVQDTFYDTDGEYTSRGMVGDVWSDVYQLLESQSAPELAEIDRDEARALLIGEINTLAGLTPQPPTGLGVATVATEAMGAGGKTYFLRMSIEEISDTRFAISGTVYAEESRRFAVLKERLEYDVRPESKR
jgi:hypothetical protein